MLLAEIMDGLTDSVCNAVDRLRRQALMARQFEHSSPQRIYFRELAELRSKLAFEPEKHRLYALGSQSRPQLVLTFGRERIKERAHTLRQIT